MPSIHAFSPAERFAYILDGMCKALGARASWRLGPNEVPSSLLMLIWKRLSRLSARFTRALETLPSTRTRASRAGRNVTADGAITSRKPDPLPRTKAWLTRLVPETNLAGHQLRDFLIDPEIIAIITADPRLGRIVRPLCQMLFIRREHVPYLYPKKNPAVPSAAQQPPAEQSPGATPAADLIQSPPQTASPPVTASLLAASPLATPPRWPSAKNSPA